MVGTVLILQEHRRGYGYGNPITYRTKSGRQFIIIATSESDGSDASLDSFALPD